MTMLYTPTHTDKIKKAAQSMKSDKRTTAAGGIAVLLSVITTLLPENVRTQCMDTILTTGDPKVTAGLLLIGVGLAIWGPSLGSRRTGS